MDVVLRVLPFLLPLALLAYVLRTTKGGRIVRAGARPGPRRITGRVVADPLSPGALVRYRLPDGTEQELTVRDRVLRPGQRVAVVVDPARPQEAAIGPRHVGLGLWRTLLLIAGVFALLYGYQLLVGR